MSPRANVYILGFPNGKCYVGITSKTVGERFKKHVWGAKAGSTYPKHRALMKYGSENVRVMTIVTDVSWDQATDLEVWWISRLDTFNKDSGYNMTAGGDGTMGWKPSQETRAKISKASKEQQHLAREETIAEMVGKRYGLWAVLNCNEEETEQRRASVFNCRCTCGEEKPVLSDSLRRGESRGCQSCRKLSAETITKMSKSSKKQRRLACEKLITEMMGKLFGRWTVLSYNAQKSERRGMSYFTCRCTCGEEKPILGSSLRSGRSKGCLSCACIENRRRKREEIIAEMVGKPYDCWTVLGYNEQESERQSKLVLDCRCACGVEKPVLSNSLRRGKSKGCPSCAQTTRHREAAAKENYVTTS